MIPKNHRQWVEETLPNGNKYIITSNEVRTTYYLFRVEKDGVRRIASGKSPKDFEDKLV